MVRNILFGIDKKKSIVCIEAGIQGWNSIELKELLQSSIEYLDSSSVIKLSINRNNSYLLQVIELLRNKNITHYIYDPRTGSQNWLFGFIQSILISLIFMWYNITPIVILTDLAIIKWRNQALVVTANRGQVVSLFLPKVVSKIFPHNRICGPLIMPLSKKTNNYLNNLISEKIQTDSREAIFAGSLYEPRASILKEIQSNTRKLGQDLRIIGREIGQPKDSDNLYWERLVNADIVVTTAVQMIQTGADWTHLPHFIYRYIEVLAAGSLLIAEEIPGISRYFNPDEHFVTFESPLEASKKISFYLNNDNERRLIAIRGKQRANEIINSQTYWQIIDSSLGKHSLL